MFTAAPGACEARKCEIPLWTNLPHNGLCLMLISTKLSLLVNRVCIVELVAVPQHGASPCLIVDEFAAYGLERQTFGYL